MNDHRKHAKLSASGSHRWLACPGSVMLEADFPEDVVSEFAEYGTAGHELAQKCLEQDRQAYTFGNEYLNKSVHFPDGFHVDSEMTGAVQIYLDYCNSLGEGESKIEERVDFSDYVNEGFGTADFIKIKKNEIYVVDLKMGKGVRVYAEENTQGMLYALGVVWDSKLADNDLIHIVIVQPRLDHISEWSITVYNLLTWARDYVRPRAEQAWSGQPIFNAGESQCRFCKAKPTCKALAEHSLQTAMDVFTDIPTDGDLKEIYTLTNDELGSLLPRVDTLLSWAKSLESHALGELNSGNKIKGYKLVMGRAGNRKWTNEKKAQDHLTVLGLNEDEIYSKKINTPAQMCRILKDKKIDVGETENLWNSPEGKTTIAIESDKRVEILPPSIAGFSDIET
tara:strand:+ start:5843 stop:7027 length:1185 start_codon:yes stop_codon:yes gene_type:complete